MSYLENFDRLVRDERQMKALTGVSKKEFKSILPFFKEAIEQIKEEEYQARIKRRKKKISRRANVEHAGKLDTAEKKLFYILNYLKTYSSFDVQGANFGYNRGTACIIVHRLTFVLLKALQNMGVTPKRKINKPEDFKKVFGEDVSKIILDATERKYFRHKNYEKQKENYSGKKNSTQRKIY
jgi:hypothetical protein